MKSKDACIDLLASSTKIVENVLGIKVRNGQQLDAFRKTLAWVLKE